MKQEDMRWLLCISSGWFLVFLLFGQTSAGAADETSISKSATSVVSRADFPPGFVFGAGTSAYQIEGAAAEDGRKPSIWDTFVHEGRSLFEGTGDIASDQYHKYKDDVKLMRKLGIDAYRMSISWSRVIPDGHGAVNPKGLNYYNDLINELISNGIEAHVTLSHFDIPQALQDEYEGYLSPKFIEDFTAYAEICFKEYGDRVKSWITFNEPNVLTVGGNDVGFIAPGRCSYPFGFGVNCSEGNSTTEPYIGSHNILLSHAAAVHLYRTKYQEKQKGQIGVTLLAYWFEPLTSSPLDIAAAERALDFSLGWYLDPLVYGRYPAVMTKIVGSRLPHFKDNDSKLLKGSFDFIGLNYYITFYVQDLPRTTNLYGSDYYGDLSVNMSFTSGTPLFSLTQKQSHWQGFTWMKADGGGTMAVQGLQRMLEYIREKYESPAVVIHENGYPTGGASSNDTERIKSLKSIIGSLLQSIRYTTWYRQLLGSAGIVLPSLARSKPCIQWNLVRVAVCGAFHSNVLFFCCRRNGIIHNLASPVMVLELVIVRDIVCRSVIAQFRAHRNPVSALHFDPSGTLLVTASVQGNTLNVFRIMPTLNGDSSESDSDESYVHLYKLQRGITNAVIQDISFSEDSHWIMISSSKGTCHLFAINPAGGECIAFY